MRYSIFLFFLFSTICFSQEGYTESQKRVAKSTLESKGFFLPMSKEDINRTITKGEFFAAMNEILNYFEKEINNIKRQPFTPQPTASTEKIEREIAEIRKEIEDLRKEDEVFLKIDDFKKIMQNLRKDIEKLNSEIENLKYKEEMIKREDYSPTIWTFIIFGILTIGRILTL